MSETWYRLENYLESAGVNEFDNPVGPPNVRVAVRVFEVEKHTPKGVWLKAFMFRRFVLASAKRRFACPTLDEALESFKKRKAKQLAILKRKQFHVEMAVYLADNEVRLYRSYRCEHDYGMFDVCRKCGQYGGHQPGA